MISSVAWVRKGVSQRIPDKYDLTDVEFDRVKDLAQKELNAAKEAFKENQPEEYLAHYPNENDDELKEYNLDTYDNPIQQDTTEEDPVPENSFFGRVKGLAYHDSNELDPYITFRGPSGAPLNDALDAEEEAQDREDLAVLPTDNLILAARTEDELSQLDVCVYEGEDVGNLYVHHDMMLPAFPLCLEWLDYRVGKKSEIQGGGSYVAIGTFDPEIEIWDLDTTDAMYPDAILGAADPEEPKKKGKKAKKSRKVNKHRHVDAVLGLAWNPLHRNLLASASADTTVKLWDLRTLQCSHSYSHHTDKVQSVRWHPTDGTVLLTGSFDKTVCALDSRAPDSVARWKVTSDPEAVRWDPFNSHLFYVSNEDGMVQCFDARNAPAAASNGSSTAVFTLHAHDRECTGMDLSSLTPGLMATGGSDKVVKIWDVADGKPKLIISRNMEVGKVFSLAFSPDSPMTLAAGGSAGKTHIWDIAANAGARRAFEGRSSRGVDPVVGASPHQQQEEDRQEVIGIEDDAEEDEDQEEVVQETSHGTGGGSHGDDEDEDEDDDGEEMGEDDVAMEEDVEMR